MNCTFEILPSGETCLHITAEWREVAADYEDLLAGYRGVALPGFRPGAAPRAAIEQRFRRRLRDEFASRCGRRLVREALRARNLRVAGLIPVVELRLEPRREFSFAAECVPVPMLELPDYAALKLTSPTADERRDEMAAWLLERTAWDVPEPLVRRECERREPAEAGSEAWLEARKRVKLMAILEQIAELEGIDPGEREVDARIEKLAGECSVDAVDLRRQLGAGGVERLRSLLRAEETLAHLLGEAGQDTSGGKELLEGRWT